MSTCAIRYRLNAPGPSAFIVDCSGGMRMYTRGTLGAKMPDGYVNELLGARASRWVPASGELILDIELDDDRLLGWEPLTGDDAASLVRAGGADIDTQGAISA